MTINIDFSNNKGILLFTKNTVEELKPYVLGQIIKHFSIQFSNEDNINSVITINEYLKSYIRG